ncbi:uncharacterized protein I303_103169 [Kwoniella dejecticola CBS 10117]|uniref:Uncharacterized protein n=1 Tax=Kwoniella dejecticola CBS 10117 TaxID=1296121 RepID=A0A1A6AAS4_9TREE|nr:uncharacterized protein I303_03190 [Kwoniella dejecticola CBS 10117]OBR87166.1 hypothetical protein I303_03190 [Kwoniella dejecticola CBS 10117]
MPAKGRPKMKWKALTGPLSMVVKVRPRCPLDLQLLSGGKIIVNESFDPLQSATSSTASNRFRKITYGAKSVAVKYDSVKMPVMSGNKMQETFQLAFRSDGSDLDTFLALMKDYFIIAPVSVMPTIGASQTHTQQVQKTAAPPEQNVEPRRALNASLFNEQTLADRPAQKPRETDIRPAADSDLPGPETNNESHKASPGSSHVHNTKALDPKSSVVSHAEKHFSPLQAQDSMTERMKKDLLQGYKNSLSPSQPEEKSTKVPSAQSPLDRMPTSQDKATQHPEESPIDIHEQLSQLFQVDPPPDTSHERKSVANTSSVFDNGPSLIVFSPPSSQPHSSSNALSEYQTLLTDHQLAAQIRRKAKRSREEMEEELEEESQEYLPTQYKYIKTEEDGQRELSSTSMPTLSNYPCPPYSLSQEELESLVDKVVMDRGLEAMAHRIGQIADRRIEALLQRVLSKWTRETNHHPSPEGHYEPDLEDPPGHDHRYQFTHRQGYQSYRRSYSEPPPPNSYTAECYHQTQHGGYTNFHSQAQHLPYYPPDYGTDHPISSEYSHSTSNSWTQPESGCSDPYLVPFRKTQVSEGSQQELADYDYEAEQTAQAHYQEESLYQTSHTRRSLTTTDHSTDTTDQTHPKRGTDLFEYTQPQDYSQATFNGQDSIDVLEPHQATQRYQTFADSQDMRFAGNVRDLHSEKSLPPFQSFNPHTEFTGTLRKNNTDEARDEGGDDDLADVSGELGLNEIDVESQSQVDFQTQTQSEAKEYDYDNETFGGGHFRPCDD